MRGGLLLVVFAGAAHAEPPESSVRDQTQLSTKRLSLGFDTGVQMRSDGAASVGVGRATRLALGGGYELSVGLMRWQALDDDDKEHSWEASVRAYRHVRISKRMTGHVVGGLDAERVTRGDVGSFNRVGALIGAGLSWNVVDRVQAWTELTLESKRWLDRPPGVERDNEIVVTLMFGFTF